MRVAALAGAAFAALSLAACATDPLVQAMNSGDDRLVVSLLDQGVDYKQTVWAGNYDPMEYAAAYGKNQAIREMVKRGADVNFGHEISMHWEGLRYTPLSRAVMNTDSPHVETVRLLLSLGAKVDPISWDFTHAHERGVHVDPAIVGLLEEARERQAHPAAPLPAEPSSAKEPSAPAVKPWWGK